MQQMGTNGQLERIAPVAGRYAAQQSHFPSRRISREVHKRYRHVRRKRQCAGDQEGTVGLVAIIVRRHHWLGGSRGWRVVVVAV
jgi:hypothetical protein